MKRFSSLTDRKLALGFASVGFTLAAIAGGVASATGSNDQPSKKFGIEVGATKDGRSYGSIFDAEEGGPVYDLVSVIGIEGRRGYVDRKAYEALKASYFAVGSPSDAVAGRQRSRLAAGDLSLPVFETDGVTQIDTYVLGHAKGFKQIEGVDPEEFQTRPVD